MNTYRGIVLKQHIQKMIAENFPPVSCETGLKDCTCDGHRRIPGQKGRPQSKAFSHFSSQYHRELPGSFQEKISQDVNLIRATVDALCEARRDLTPAEQEYILNSRDAQYLGILHGEPVQIDYFNRFLVRRDEDESLGMACLRQYRRIVDFCQEDSNILRIPLYVYLERYCIERQLRDAKCAEDANVPMDARGAVGLMSKNIAAFVVTDNPKYLKGSIALVAYIEPEIKVRMKKTEEQLIQSIDSESLSVV